MTEAEVLQKLRDRLEWGMKGGRSPRRGRVYVEVHPSVVKEAASFLFNDLGARYVTSAGVDKRPLTGNFEVIHFFAFDRDGFYLALKFPVDAESGRFDSITPIIPGASWAEREIRDLLGLEPVGHPDPRKLVLADDWPEGIHPLRKDIPYNIQPERVSSPQELAPPPPGTSVFPLGPIHPALKEPIHFRLFVNGETVVGCDHRGFYVHRGIEKLGDSALTYNQIPFIAERICGICGTVHSTSYCQAVEDAAGIEVPERARFIRTIFLELERIQSHILWLGVALHLIGFDTLFMQTWRIREPVMWLCEKLSGNRKHYGVNLVGGVRWDIPKEVHPEVLEVLKQVEREFSEAARALVGDTVVMMRLKGVGIIDEETARKVCVVGPTARGSGVDIDVRRDLPYAAYAEVGVDVKVHDGMDNWARTIVRVEETFESINIIRRALKMMPDGPIRAEIEEEIPPGLEGMGSVEAPRGEVFHYVLTGENNGPYRWKVRAPSYVNIPVTLYVVPGLQVADAPITYGSLDPCVACTERVEVVDVRSGEVRAVDQEELAKGRWR